MNQSISTELIDQLKILLQGIENTKLSDPSFLKKWLVATEGQVEFSAIMIKNHLRWREAENIDNIFNDQSLMDNFSQYIIGGIFGHDKMGYPCLLLPVGRIDPIGIINCVCTKKFVRSQILKLEQIYRIFFPQRSKDENRKIDKITIIFDLAQFSTNHISRSFLDYSIEAAKVIEKNYPDTVHKILIINYPSIFWAAFKFVKSFLRKATVEKIVMLNSIDNLNEYISKDQLLTIYGGNAVDTENLIKWGGEIEISYYPEKFIDNPQSFVLSKKEVKRLEFKISRNSNLYYEFFTLTNDIIYSISRKSENDESVEKYLNLPMKVNSNLVKEHGTIFCGEDGVYIVTFDNSGSWMKSKTVFYKIEIKQ